MLKPQFTIVPEVADAQYGKFIIEPLPQGFGHTLGNSLRRVLYSAIPGAAITSVKINGATHQFTSIEGVKEDVVQLVLALKQVRLAYTGEQPTTISLSAKGPGPVTAGQFDTESLVTVANPELVIANLSDKSSKLELEATVEAGLGYSPADDHRGNTVGVIAIDSMYSPVIRVNFQVEATRVGRVTNFDRLVLEVTTDGTIAPAEAVAQAASTLVEFFSLVANPQAEGSVGSAASAARGSGQPSLSVEELDLPTRITNALTKSGFDTVASLLATPRAELAKVKNLGGKSVKIIEAALAQRGIELP
jgi:DNA-directed RNA polymerase subunit alpha